MLCRRNIRISAYVAVIGLITTGLLASAQSTDRRGRKYKAPPATARVEITVLRDTDAKPIENAAVIFHPMVHGRDEGNMELKSNEDGKAVIDVLPIGNTVRLQIIAKGFQTYGQDYKIDKDQMAFEVRMKRPGGQYSVYKPDNDPQHELKKDDGKGDDKKDSDKPAPDDKPKP
ncbi:carboxypeptidase regulatory-like domain-containing protein [Acidobacteria bacterium AB60]|nr:carboxypeptidase regulatory-like domain-containing protein [Acidobacteria bacterium AB60]